VLDFAASAALLAARVNGLNPRPGVSLELGSERVKVGLAEADATGSDGSGRTGSPATGSRLERRHRAEGQAPPSRWQASRGGMLPVADFPRGHPVAAGTVIPSTPMPPLVTRR
jgi:methionyl-tRNA formyltransferase